MAVYVQYRIEFQSYDIFITQEIEGQGRYFLQADGTKRFVARNTYPSDLAPTIRLDDYQAKELIEALQRSGLQPKQLTLIEGQYAAQSEHLKDLQKILRKQGVME